MDSIALVDEKQALDEIDCVSGSSDKNYRQSPGSQNHESRRKPILLQENCKNYKRDTDCDRKHNFYEFTPESAGSLERIQPLKRKNNQKKRCNYKHHFCIRIQRKIK